jgi:hypothetical protein
LLRVLQTGALSEEIPSIAEQARDKAPSLP